MHADIGICFLDLAGIVALDAALTVFLTRDLDLHALVGILMFAYVRSRAEANVKLFLMLLCCWTPFSSGKSSSTAMPESSEPLSWSWEFVDAW